QSALRIRGYTRASGLLLRMNGLAADDSAVDLDVHDGVRAHLVRILLEDDEIRQLAGGDRALELFFRRSVGAVDGGDGQRLVAGDLLVRPPHPAPVDR